MGTALRTAGGAGAKQPVAELFRLAVFVQGDNSYGASKISAYTGAFSDNGGILTCKASGTYHIRAYASFRYGWFRVTVNGEVKLTVDGHTVGWGGIAEAEADVMLTAGDVVSTEISFLSYAGTRFAAGNAVIFAKG